jgi:TonB family protein
MRSVIRGLSLFFGLTQAWSQSPPTVDIPPSPPPVLGALGQSMGADCNDKAHSYWDAPPSFWKKFYNECPPKQVATLYGEPVYATRGDLRPTVLEHPTPPLPPNSKKISAEVTLAVIVSKTGQVANASVLQSSGDKAIDDLAERTVKTWRFKPAKQYGKGVAVQQNLIVVLDRGRS